MGWICVDYVRLSVCLSLTTLESNHYKLVALRLVCAVQLVTESPVYTASF